jgi:hypothetical protein
MLARASVETQDGLAVTLWKIYYCISVYGIMCIGDKFSNKSDQRFPFFSTRAHQFLRERIYLYQQEIFYKSLFGISSITYFQRLFLVKHTAP